MERIKKPKEIKNASGEMRRPKDTILGDVLCTVNMQTFVHFKKFHYE